MHRASALLAGLLLTAACYHATIETGARPSGEELRKDWASGWIYGLVPPSAVETAARCPNGVARVETQLTFVNQLVAFLTLYIYTPMSIRVSCAAAPAGTDEPVVRQGGALDTPAAALHEALDVSRRLGVPVRVEFR